MTQLNLDATSSKANILHKLAAVCNYFHENMFGSVIKGSVYYVVDGEEDFKEQHMKMYKQAFKYILAGEYRKAEQEIDGLINDFPQCKVWL